MEHKLKILKNLLGKYTSAVIAFSGGVDSTFLARIAKDVYGEKITKEKLDRLATAEFEVRKLGFSQFRIRSHENLARFEFIPAEMDKAWGIRDNLAEICQRSGYNYITIDLNGYRSGSMNETLSDSDKLSYQNSDTE